LKCYKVNRATDVQKITTLKSNKHFLRIGFYDMGAIMVWLNLPQAINRQRRLFQRRSIDLQRGYHSTHKEVIYTSQ